MALFFAYMLITAIMLVNLLIAIFTFNFLLEHCAQTTTSSAVAEGPRDAGYHSRKLPNCCTVMFRAEFKPTGAVCRSKGTEGSREPRSR